MCVLCSQVIDIQYTGRIGWTEQVLINRFNHGHPICPKSLDHVEDSEYYQIPEKCFLYKYHTKEMMHVEIMTLNEKGVTENGLGL